MGAVLLLAGFLAGIACVCFFPGLFVQNPGFLDTDTLSGISEWNRNRTGLFLYCLQKRLGITVLFVLLALSGAGMICLIVLAVGSGLAAGMILTVLSLRYGIRGSFFFLAALVASLQSSCDAFLVSCSALFTQNFYRRWLVRAIFFAVTALI